MITEAVLATVRNSEKEDREQRMGYRFSDSYREELCKLFNVAGQRSEPLCLNLSGRATWSGSREKGTFIFRIWSPKAWPCWPASENSFLKKTSTFLQRPCPYRHDACWRYGYPAQYWERQAHYLYKENALHWKRAGILQETYIPTI